MLAQARTIALVAALGAAGSPFVAQADEADADDAFRSAAEHYAQRDWQAACDDFARMLADAPDDARASDARFHYGEALVQLGRYQQAGQEFDTLLSHDPEHRYARQALFRSGEAALLAGDRAAARRQLQAFRQRYPDDALNAIALSHLGRIERDEGNPAAAEPLLSAAVERYPRSPLVEQSRWGLAEALSQLKRVDEARVQYEKLADSHGRFAEFALLRLAALDNERGNHAAALVWLDRMAKEYPHGALADRATLGRGYALYKLGRSDEAEAALSSILKNPSLAVDAHYWLGMSQFNRNVWKEAAATFAAGAAIDPQHRWNETLAYQAACALLNDQQFAAAAQQFDRVLNQWPASAWADACWLGKLQSRAAENDHAAVVKLADEFAATFPASRFAGDVEAAKGRALAALGQHAEAAKVLEKSLGASAAHTPQTKTADAGLRRRGSQQVLATSYAELGRFAEARRIVESWYGADAKRAPANDATCYRVAELAYAADDLETAAALFTLLANQKDSSDALRRGLLGLAWCRHKAQDWQAAADAFGTLLERFPGAASAVEAALLRGRALEHLDDTSGALAMYRRVMDRHPDSPRAAEAIYRAAALHERLGEASAAVDMYSRVVEQHAGFPQRDAALYHWAWLLHETDPRTADKLFARLRSEFADSPFVPQATLQLADRAFDDQRYGLARALLPEITTDNTPEDVRRQALYLSGRVSAAQGEWSEAESSLARLIDEAPHGELALAAAYLRAEASYRRGRYAESAERLAALSANAQSREQPFSAAVQLRRAHALVQLKQWHEALEVARTLSTESPDFEQGYEVDYVIGRCLAAQADFAGARAAYTRVLESPRAARTETAALAQWMIGETYYHQEDFAAASAEYEQVERKFPAARVRAAALLQAGKCHEHLGHWDAAVAAYQRMIKECPESDLAEEAARRVAAAQAHVAQRLQQPN
jgi:TolA-binding protein